MGKQARINQAQLEAKGLKDFSRRSVDQFRRKFGDVNSLMVVLLELSERLKTTPLKRIKVSKEFVVMARQYRLISC